MSGFTFGGVGTIEAKKPAKKSDSLEVVVDGIYDLAAIDEVMATLKTVRSDLETDIKAVVKEGFIEAGCATKIKPANYHGVENEASASIELRKRSSASKLSDEEIKLCLEWGIETQEVEDTVETFVINPEVLSDAKVMGALEKYIGDGIKAGKLPANIILKQEGVKRTLLVDNALDTLFAKGREIVEKAFSLCSTQAVGKTKFPGSIADALKVADRLIPAFAAKAAAAKATGKSKKAA